MNTLSAIPSPRFLHICGLDYLSSPNELSIDLQSLGKVLLTWVVWDIYRSGSMIETHKWPWWKAIFLTESDFEDPNDAWLLEHTWRHRQWTVWCRSIYKKFSSDRIWHRRYFADSSVPQVSVMISPRNVIISNQKNWINPQDI